MTTDLKTLIERKLDAQKLVSINGANQDYFDEQFHHLKSEVLPILLECAAMMQELRKYSRHNLSCDIKSMKAECDCGFAKIADEYTQALERLRKWSEVCKD